jgi:hypothetical protein
MRSWLALLITAACGGPTQQQLVETPSATTKATATEAPPASTSDVDRYRLTQQFDDMETTQRAYREAGQENKKPPKAAAGMPSSKKAPVESAPVEPTALEQVPKK